MFHGDSDLVPHGFNHFNLVGSQRPDILVKKEEHPQRFVLGGQGNRVNRKKTDVAISDFCDILVNGHIFRNPGGPFQDHLGADGIKNLKEAFELRRLKNQLVRSLDRAKMAESSRAVAIAGAPVAD